MNIPEYDESAAVESDLPAVICVITGNNISNNVSNFKQVISNNIGLFDIFYTV